MDVPSHSHVAPASALSSFSMRHCVQPLRRTFPDLSRASWISLARGPRMPDFQKFPVGFILCNMLCAVFAAEENGVRACVCDILACGRLCEQEWP